MDQNEWTVAPGGWWAPRKFQRSVHITTSSSLQSVISSRLTPRNPPAARLMSGFEPDPLLASPALPKNNSYLA